MVIAGSVGLSQQQWRSFGVEAAIGLCGDGVTEEEAMDDCERLLEELARDFARKFLKYAGGQVKLAFEVGAFLFAENILRRHNWQKSIRMTTSTWQF